ncbi:hypothetical protein KFK09_004411 [Dendrobium nobile]|uniref:DUF4283 domain-containing protein n=1 Tax=Dendrobium nobile TaxID=94219 RepID=A0A8T3C5Z8_DENNO|nr:hypothetical protein KFK09_004411 [Dendrobium nobile]
MAPLRDPGFLVGPSSLSFKDALAGSVSSPKVFPDLKVSSHRGLLALLISEAEIHDLTAPFEFALVGKFPSRRPSMEAIRSFFFKLKLFGEVSVTVLNQRNVLIKFFNDLDYCRVFAHRSYFVSNCYMKLSKWSPSLDIDVDSPVIPIWISFPNLRPHLFASRILHGLGSVFGKPLKTDNATSIGSRPSMARVLVELDVSKSFPDIIWIGSECIGYVQNVVFEDVPALCVHCSALGHLIKGYRILHPNLEYASYPLGVSVPEVRPSIEVNFVVPEPCVNVAAVTDPVALGSGRDFDEDGRFLPSLVSDSAIPLSLNVDNSSVDQSVLGNLMSPVVVNNGTVITDEEVNHVDDVFLLSPNAIPFVPSIGLDVSVREDGILVSKENGVSEVMFGVVNRRDSVGSPILGVVNSNGVGSVLKGADCIVVVPDGIEVQSQSTARDVISISNTLVEVPVSEVGTHVMATCVGNPSGVDMRKQNDWLYDSSEESSNQELVESDRDFALVRPSNIGSRGKFWGRGRRRR